MVKTKIQFENGYSINLKKEKIPHIGRSIYREIDDHQFVLQICDPSGKVTKRLGIPAKHAAQVADFMTK